MKTHFPAGANMLMSGERRHQGVLETIIFFLNGKKKKKWVWTLSDQVHLGLQVAVHTAAPGGSPEVQPQDGNPLGARKRDRGSRVGPTRD